MGLFSTLIHVYRVEQPTAIAALNATLSNAGFVTGTPTPVPKGGPSEFLKAQDSSEPRPLYLISQRAGNWLSIIEARYINNAPDTAEVARAMSESLSTYSLSLLVHDDDLMFYNLFLNGRELDGYNSNPQYFENDRVDEDHVEGQRHSPEEFAPILPAGVSIEELRQLLNRGWWNGHDNGRLDEEGVESEDSDGFVFEGERMSEFGTLLRLHGPSAEGYPFAAWLEDPRIPWSTFQAMSYAGPPSNST